MNTGFQKGGAAVVDTAFEKGGDAPTHNFQINGFWPEFYIKQS